MNENAGAIVFVLLVVVFIVGFFVWRSQSMQGPGGLTLEQAGQQKAAAVAAGASSAASSST